MKIAIWIIAVCEVVRAVQNALQLRSLAASHDAMNRAYDSIAKMAGGLDLLDEDDTAPSEEAYDDFYAKHRD